MSLIRLVVFDVDGTLVRVKSSWGYLHRYFGVEREAQKYMRMFEEGEISYIDWMRLDTELWIKARGGRVHRSEIIDALSKVEIDPDAPRLFRELRRRRVFIALVSSGIDLLVRRIATELGADAWVANRLLFDREGFLVPGGSPLVGVDKAPAVKRIAAELGVPLDATAYVGDSHWDASAMRAVAYPIAVGDDPRLNGVAKIRVERLGQVLEVLKPVLPKPIDGKPWLG